MKRRTLHALAATFSFFAAVALFSPPAFGAEEPAARPLWSVPSGGSTSSLVLCHAGVAVVCAGEYVEFGSPNHRLVALDPFTGRVIWKADAGAGVMCEGPARHGDKLEWGTGEGKRRLLDLKTGRTLSGPAKESSGASDGNASPGTVRLEGRRLVKTVPGGTAWEKTFAHPVSALREEGGLVLCAEAVTRRVYALRSTDGQTVWQVDVPPVPGVQEPDAANFRFLLADGILLVANYDGMVHAWAVDGPEAPFTVRVRVDPSGLTAADEGELRFTEDAGVQKAAYVRYVFQGEDLRRACGGQVPKSPFTAVVSVRQVHHSVSKPADPALPAPVDGFRWEDRHVRVLGLLAGER